MKCPECGVEMVEEYRRIKVKPVVGTSPSTLRQKTKMKRTWKCHECGRRYALLMRVVEVEEV